jgi:hypothetical protein
LHFHDFINSISNIKRPNVFAELDCCDLSVVQELLNGAAQVVGGRFLELDALKKLVQTVLNMPNELLLGKVCTFEIVLYQAVQILLFNNECFNSAKRISELMGDASINESQKLILALLVFEILN